MIKIKKDPKKASLPQLEMGVREQSNIRMKKFARPICPIQDLEELVQRDGTIIPNPNYDGSINCQREMNGYPGWWIVCEKRGHDPYFTVKRRIVKEPVVDEEQDGLITGYRERRVVTKKLNMTQVALGTRFHSGRGEAISVGLKGRKELSEFGYNDLCEYRNCERDATIDTRYGKFCGDRHARLIGADVESFMLETSRNQTLKKSANKQLKEIDLDFEVPGRYEMQLPPDVEGADL